MKIARGVRAALAGVGSSCPRVKRYLGSVVLGFFVLGFTSPRVHLSFLGSTSTGVHLY